MKKINRYNEFIYENKMLDEILDKISAEIPLSPDEEKFLDLYSKDQHKDLEDKIKKRELEYNRMLTGDLRGEFPVDINDEEMINMNLEALWDTMDEDDIIKFILEYDLPSEIISYTWEILSDSEKDKFKEFVSRYA